MDGPCSCVWGSVRIFCIYYKPEWSELECGLPFLDHLLSNLYEKSNITFHRELTNDIYRNMILLEVGGINYAWIFIHYYCYYSPIM